MAPSREVPSAAWLWTAGAALVCLAAVVCGSILTGSYYLRPASAAPGSTILTRPGSTSTPLLQTIEPLTPLPAPDGPSGKIVYVCQVFSVQERDQICLINADGSGQRRLTTDDYARNFYPSLSPDGRSVLYSSNQDGNFEIYELILDTGQQIRLGGTAGIAPEVSPDDRYVAFTRSDGQNTDTIWVMDRYGLNPHEVYPDGWDPTWAPDGSRILFATMVQKLSQLATISLDGSGFRVISNLPDLRGRSDWSSDGLRLITYSGPPWGRELYLMNADGSGEHQLGRTGGDSQGPSFSPDGHWVVFTAYFDHYRNINGCELYIMRIDGSDLRRLTDNNYCDWQPRWGP